MESAALFIMASLRGIKAGAIFGVKANKESHKDRVLGKQLPVTIETRAKETKKVVDHMVAVALEVYSPQ